MAKKNNILNAVILFAVIAVLLVPLAQKLFLKLPEKPLSGDVQLAQDVSFNTHDWLEGTYASAKEKYVNDQFGFRNSFLRSTDQLYYSLFGAVFARDVVPGRDGYLYELKYLQTHAGMDYVGDAEVTSRFEKIKFIQDALAKKGIHFAVLFAPGKATFFPEHIPAPYDHPSATTNYLKFIEQAKKKGIHYIDYNALFLRLKPSAKYPLYPQTGTHWSIYGMHIAFDTLTRYMERVSGKRLPHYDYSTVALQDSLRTPDGDIAEGLNLIQNPAHYKMGYPVIKWLDSSNTARPTVLTVSDSYWMGIYYLGLPQNTFGHHEFWYYNKQVFNYDPQGNTGDAAVADLKTAVEKNDFVFIMATEASLKQMGWGFIDDVYNMYKNGPAAYEKAKRERKRNSELSQTKMAIRNDDAWFKFVRKQATQLHISIDSCVQMNAEYAYTEKHRNDPAGDPKEVLKQKTEAYKAAIRADKVWLKKVSDKAAEKGISVDASIETDATWMAEEELHLPHEAAINREAFNKRVQEFKSAMKADPEWMKKIALKAKEKGISADSSMSLDAAWMAEQELKKK